MRLKDKKVIAWGASPLLEIFMKYCKTPIFDYVVDSAPDRQSKAVEGVNISSPDALYKENPEDVFVIITAMSSSAIQAIHGALSRRGFVLGVSYTDLADFLKTDFKKKAERVLNLRFSNENLTFARTFNYNSKLPLETTILGNWLLMEAIEGNRHLKGSIAEVGAFRCGNAFLQMSKMTLSKDYRKYYIFDSFQGFPDMSDQDPHHLKNAYDFDYGFEELKNVLSVFRQAVMCRGYVPETFNRISRKEKFSLVFYDCDLYQPALDTYEFFWDRLESGGVLVIHDNIATRRGWTGVKKATNEFFLPRDITVSDLWESTMSVIVKE